MPTLATYQGVVPKIRWGPMPPAVGDPLDLLFGYPLAQARSWCEPSVGSEFVHYPAGIEEAWIDEEDAFLEGVVDHVPYATQAMGYGVASGWFGDNGWLDFLEWARRGYPFEFWRDATDADSMLSAYLEAPLAEAGDPDAIGLFRFTLRIRSADLTRFGGY